MANAPADDLVEGGAIIDNALPSLEEICETQVFTMEFVGKGLLPLAGQEFLKCAAWAVHYNRSDAGDFKDGSSDTPSKLRSRTAWLELFMFPRACLPALPGGQAKDNRHRELLGTVGSGGTMGIMGGVAASLTRAAEEPIGQTCDGAAEERGGDCIAMRGLPAKAADGLVSSGLALDTAEVEAIMRSKFTEPPPSPVSSSRPPAPLANELLEEGVAKAILSFPRGGGPGPTKTATGLRETSGRTQGAEARDRAYYSPLQSFGGWVGTSEAAAVHWGSHCQCTGQDKRNG